MSRRLKDPVVRNTWKGVKRTIGTAVTRKAAATIDEIRQMLEHVGDRTIDIRDRALLLRGFSGALRRSELVALDVEDLTFVDGGVDLRIVKSKTDQEGKGGVLEIKLGSRPATCPVGAVRRWLEAAGIVEVRYFAKSIGTATCRRRGCPTKASRASSRSGAGRPGSTRRSFPATA